MKIRGTAAHIAEKYMSLARDAQASGDSVTAESYFQHAEHYNRIIMAAQMQLGSQSHSGDGANGGGFRPRWNPEVSDSPEGGGAAIEAAEAAGGEEIRSTQQGRSEQRRRHGGNGAQGEARENEDPEQAASPQTDESAPDRA